jgi:hypothetical protein
MARVRIIKFGDTYGLCNRLFPFAHLIASAIEYDWTVQNEGFFEFAKFFSGTCDYAVPAFPHGGRSFGSHKIHQSCFHWSRRLAAKLGTEQRIVLGDHDVYDLSRQDLRDQLEQNRSTQCIGLYYHNNQAMINHAATVRRFFRPVNHICTMISESVIPARAGADVLVGVHIRHGDYETFCGGIMYYTFDEYAQLMRTVADLFPGKRVSFLISSNAKPPTDAFRHLRIHVGPGHVVGDLYSLAECDYIIGPPSTYSEWASFYGEVPRYMHRAKDYEWNGQPWPGVTLDDFVVHREGFARCAPSHPASLIPKGK